MIFLKLKMNIFIKNVYIFIFLHYEMLTLPSATDLKIQRYRRFNQHTKCPFIPKSYDFVVYYY